MLLLEVGGCGANIENGGNALRFGIVTISTAWAASAFLAPGQSSGTDTPGLFAKAESSAPAPPASHATHRLVVELRERLDELDALVRRTGS